MTYLEFKFSDLRPEIFNDIKNMTEIILLFLANVIMADPES